MRLPATLTIFCYVSKDNWSHKHLRLTKAPKVAGDANAFWHRRVTHTPRKSVKPEAN